jgi:phosphoribosyl 1,2-cyclic phosphodiesterase
MAEAEPFFVRFWGVRGSIACPGPATVRYGGNTSCLEIQCGEKTLVFDAGTGLRNLGNDLMGRGGSVDLDLYLTHTHFDHVCGLPFFVPLFIPGNQVRMSAGNLAPDYGLRQVLVDMMMAPLFPVPPEIFQADVSYIDFPAGDTLSPGGGVEIKTAALNHPNNATGYRIEFGGKVISYITDTEHREDGLDETVLGLIDNADIFIYDCTYTDEEYPKFKGFGHSTWQEGVRLANQAKVKTLAIFHHDPNHNDDFMDKVAKDAKTERAGTVVAYEGLTLFP